MPQNKTALITGGSSGLGYELACLFARDGYDLILVGQNNEKLLSASEKLKNANDISVKTIAKDLSFRQSPQEIFDELQKENINVEVLVNNAGLSKFGLFNEIPLTDNLSVIDVNISGLTQMTKLFLPGMIAAKNGKILNIASTAAFAPSPLMSVYFATKSYVLSFSEALSEELAGTGVSVTALCPGPTDTGFAQNTNIQNSRLYSHPMKASTVARIGYNAMMKNKKVVITGFKNNLFVQLLRIAPRSIVPKIVKNLWGLNR